MEAYLNDCLWYDQRPFALLLIFFLKIVKKCNQDLLNCFEILKKFQSEPYYH